MTEALRDYYGEHKSVFEENFKVVLESFNMESIHKMRTSIKRLRALFILMEYLSGKTFEARKQLREIRSLFRYAGHIREIQIEHRLVTDLQAETNHIYSEYLEYLKGREYREISKFVRRLPVHDPTHNILDEQEIISTFDNLEHDNLRERASEFLENKMRKICHNISRHPSNKRIHDNRIHLKQIFYLYGILSVLTQKELILGLEYERMREIEQFFGEWHDLVNSPVYMNAFFKTKNYPGDKTYPHLKKVIAEKRRTMRQEIVRTLHPEIKC